MKDARLKKNAPYSANALAALAVRIKQAAEEMDETRLSYLLLEMDQAVKANAYHWMQYIIQGGQESMTDATRENIETRKKTRQLDK